jgi:hypothetical protein
VIGPTVPRALAGGAAVLYLAACTSGSSPDAAPSSPSAADCADPTQAEALEPVPVPATGGEVAALPFEVLPPHAGSDVKIVWRITGEGDLTVRAVRPDGSEGRLSFGPEPHGGSNFSEPGAEWGTGVRFDVPGCWVVEVRRGATAGRLVVDVGR